MSHKTSAEIQQSLRQSGSVPAEWFRRDNLYGFMVTARVAIPFLVLIALLPTTYANLGLLGTVVVGFLIGVLAYKISIVMHDCCHASLFEKASWNRIVGDLGGIITGSYFPSVKYTHMLHHRYNLSDKDPQLHQLAGLDGGSRRYMAWHLSKALFGFRLVDFADDYLGISSREESSNEGSEPASGPQAKPSWFVQVVLAQLGIALIASGFGSVPGLALVYPMSAISVSLFLGRLRAVAEHVQADGEDFPDFARSHLPSLPDQALLYEAHFNYHLEHHVFPNMPSCHLPKLHETMRDEFHTSRTLSNSMFGTLLRRLRECPE